MYFSSILKEEEVKLKLVLSIIIFFPVSGGDLHCFRKE